MREHRGGWRHAAHRQAGARADAGTDTAGAGERHLAIRARVVHALPWGHHAAMGSVPAEGAGSQSTARPAAQRAGRKDPGSRPAFWSPGGTRWGPPPSRLALVQLHGVSQPIQQRGLPGWRRHGGRNPVVVMARGSRPLPIAHQRAGKLARQVAVRDTPAASVRRFSHSNALQGQINSK